MAEDEDDGKTIFGGDDEESSEEDKTLSFDEVTGNREYIGSDALEEEGGVEYEVKKIKRNESAKYTFSNEDYAIDVISTDGRVQTVNAWGLWGMIQQAYREAGEQGFESISGLHLRVGKEGRGDYNVAWSLDGETYQEVEEEE